MSREVGLVAAQLPAMSRKVAPVSREVPMPKRDTPVMSREVPVMSRKVPVMSRKVPVMSHEVPVMSGQVSVRSREVRVVACQVRPLTREVPASTRQVRAVLREVPRRTVQVRAPPRELDLGATGLGAVARHARPLTRRNSARSRRIACLRPRVRSSPSACSPACSDVPMRQQLRTAIAAISAERLAVQRQCARRPFGVERAWAVTRHSAS